MSEIIVFLTANKVKFNDLSKIFVNQGPGNFSGLRGSLAVAKGISIAKSILEIISHVSKLTIKLINVTKIEMFNINILLI
jgi:tRNA A37 threonylcarbamoyladenosine modification protein TsaB